jgi:hypothetical protein
MACRLTTLYCRPGQCVDEIEHLTLDRSRFFARWE